MRPRWVRLLTFATALLWLAIGVDGLRKGDGGFVPIAATLSGVFGLLAALLNRGGKA